MSVHAAEVVFARIIGQGCQRREDLDNPVSLCFSFNGKSFTIPRPLEDGGYTLAQLSEIEAELALCGLDLLPLDQNIVRN